MLAFAGRRILSTIPVMAIVALFVFSLLYIAPGDPAAIIAGDQATPEDIARIRVSLGLERPFLVRFGEWTWQILHGDLGTSIFTSLPVTHLIGQRIEPTLSLMAVTLVFTILVAVPMGVLAAWKAGSWIDRLIMAIAVVGFSVPVFVVGYVLVFAFALEPQGFAIDGEDWLKALQIAAGVPVLGLLAPQALAAGDLLARVSFPVQGYAPISGGIGPWLRGLVLPSLTLGFVYIALIARITRATMLEVLSQDYIKTARSKGLGQRPILFVHALKNAAVPIVTVIGIGIALLIGGAVVTESVFVIPGLGRLTVESILRRDYPIIQGITLLFSFVYVLINLAIDLIYTLVDPRIRY